MYVWRKIVEIDKQEYVHYVLLKCVTVNSSLQNTDCCMKRFYVQN
jgi:hypothetical protein